MGWIPFPIVSCIFVFFDILFNGLNWLAVRNRLWNNTGFFLLVWAVHYLPFFLMNRQLFVHHYLPSHLASALIAGAVLNFVLSETINYPVSLRGAKMKIHPRQYSDIGLKGPVIFAVFSLMLFLMFVFIAPLTYGTPGYVVVVCTAECIVANVAFSFAFRLTGEQVNSKRLLSTWTLHFAGKVSET